MTQGTRRWKCKLFAQNKSLNTMQDCLDVTLHNEKIGQQWWPCNKEKFHFLPVDMLDVLESSREGDISTKKIWKLN